MSQQAADSSGVQNLIESLRQQGVAEGEREAATLLEEARQKAKQILADAQREADQLVAAARHEASQIAVGGKAALELAQRDAVLKLQESLEQEFARRLRRLVGRQLQDSDLLAQMLRELARRSVPRGEESAAEGSAAEGSSAGSFSAEILVAPSLVRALDGQPHPQGPPDGKAARSAEDALVEFTAGLAADFLREGVTLAVGTDASDSIVMRLTDRDVDIELNETTLTSLLMRFLLPRYRALLSGKETA